MISAGRRLEERVLQIIQPYVHQDIPHFHFVNHFVGPHTAERTKSLHYLRFQNHDLIILPS